MCVSQNDSAAYSIRDLVSGNATLGIGLDSYLWVPSTAFTGIVYSNTSQYVAGDSSSITYKFGITPVPGTVYTINVTAGKCNIGGTGKLKTKTLAQKLPAPSTTPLPSSTTCLNASQNTYSVANSTLLAGVTYKWSKNNDNWTYAAGSSPTTQNVSYNTLYQSGIVF